MKYCFTLTYSIMRYYFSVLSWMWNVRKSTDIYTMHLPITIERKKLK